MTIVATSPREGLATRGDDHDVDAEYYLGAPKNERERKRSAHDSTIDDPDSMGGQEDDVAVPSTGSPPQSAKSTDASLRYGIVEEADGTLDKADTGGAQPDAT